MPASKETHTGTSLVAKQTRQLSTTKETVRSGCCRMTSSEGAASRCGCPAEETGSTGYWRLVRAVSIWVSTEEIDSRWRSLTCRCGKRTPTKKTSWTGFLVIAITEETASFRPRVVDVFTENAHCDTVFVRLRLLQRLYDRVEHLCAAPVGLYNLEERSVSRANVCLRRLC